MSDLIKKLSEIQREIHVPKTQYNSYANFHYRKLEDILSALKELMGEDCAVKFDEEVVTRGEREYVMSTATILLGSEAISASSPVMHPLKIGSMSDPQLTGTAVTYARKGAISSLLLLDDSAEVDAMDTKDEYREQVIAYHELITNGAGFEVYMYTQVLEDRDRLGLWSAYKATHVADREIGKVKTKIKALSDAGREEALRALDDLTSEDPSLVQEAENLYTEEQIEFILTLSGE